MVCEIVLLIWDLKVLNIYIFIMYDGVLNYFKVKLVIMIYV